MPELILTNTSELCLLDEIDFEYLSGWSWRISSRGYVVRTQGHINIRSHIFIHIEILKRMGFKDFEQGDHINRDTLNNYRDNLRIATYSQNQCNRGIRLNNTSGYIGVTYDKRRDKWYASIMIRGIKQYLGSFDSKEAAAFEYNCYAKLYHGEFAVLNEIK